MAEMSSSEVRGAAEAPSSNIFYRLFRLFTIVHPGEVSKALLLFINSFLIFLPIIALGGYGFATFGASLLLMKWIKAAENGTDYSLMKTARSALFLITKREEKYKAKAAIDTFFVRGGDTLSALAIFIGTTYLAAKVEGYAILNVIMVVIWIGLVLMVIKEYKKQKARADASHTAA